MSARSVPCVLRFPESFPTDAPRTSPAGYLLWHARQVKGSIAATALFSSIRFVSAVLVPFVLGLAIDSGLQHGLTYELWQYAGLIVALALVGACAITLEHIAEVRAWLRSAFPHIRMVSDHATRTGEVMTSSTPTGKVVAVIATDAQYVGNVLEILGSTIGGLAAYLVVAWLLLQESVTMALIVLIGLPLVTAVNSLVAIPLQRLQATHREAQGELTSLASDTVSGLRILRGIGGEDVFHARYSAQSQKVREAGVRMSNVAAFQQALQVLMPGVLAVAVVWVSAVLAFRGEITTGQLVAYYGYTAFLRDPVARIGFFFIHSTRAWVAAKKTVELLRLDPAAGVLGEADSGGSEIPLARSGPVLVDGTSGIAVAPGLLTVLVAEDPDTSASVLTRFARFDDGESGGVALAGQAITSYPLADVRRTVVFSGANPQLFSGKLTEELDVRQASSQMDVVQALAVADARDVLESMPDGLDGEISEKGRSLSGGQRQRVALARAILTKAPVLLLVEPTSAVDAHSERRIAANLARHRRGRTTVLASESPLVLDVADEVLFLGADGTERARGTHRELIERARDGDTLARGYYSLVTRREYEEDDEAPTR